MRDREDGLGGAVQRQDIADSHSGKVSLSVVLAQSLMKIVGVGADLKTAYCGSYSVWV